MRRVPTVLMSVALVLPAVLAVPVVTRSAPAPHPVAPVVRTWNAAPELRAAAAHRRTAYRRTAHGRAATDATGATATWDATAPLTTAAHATGSFSLVGVRWTRGGLPANEQVQVRTRTGHGAWTGWTAAEADDVGADNGTHDAKAAAALGPAVASSMIWAGHADQVQTRVTSATGTPAAAPASLQIVTINPGTSAADGSVGAKIPASSAAAAATTPTIYTRADWGADEALRSVNPGCSVPAYSSTITAAIVHHTDGGNDYAPGDVPAIIRGIYAAHVQVRGYCDIAYNFLVDRFGRIWEGRYGGVTKPVIGAHAGGFNTGTVGVAVLGRYVSTSASSAAITALQQLLSWKLGLYHLDPAGTTTLISRGTSYSAYPAGTAVPVNVISGHRDVDQTDCPGQALYAQLPTVRAGASTNLGEGLYNVNPVLARGPGGGVAGSFSASSTQPAAWSVAITDASGAVVRQFTGAVAAGAAFTAAWDGNTASGTPVPRGLYTATYAASAGTSVALPFAYPFSIGFAPGDLGVITVSGAGTSATATTGTGSGTTGTVTTSPGTTSTSGAVAVQILTQAGGYATPAVSATTALTIGNPADWSFRLAPYGGDGQADLFAIRERGSASGQVELHVLSAASDYRSYLAHVAVPLAAVDPTQWTFDLAGTDADHASDLYAIRSTGGGSGRVEVHILAAGSGYTAFSGHYATALSQTGAAPWTFLVGDALGAGDVVGVLRAGTASGRAEVHVLSRASAYQAFSLHAVTALNANAAPVYQFSLADLNGDGIPDVAVAKLQAGTSGHLELHALNGAAGDITWLAHVATGLGALDPADSDVAVLG